ncbi:hypothetical protein RHMOL_Rhmol04G0268300 [Rhododendron molle]|uniref:Uncharacterized protein n=1 Tax=Rhododendron molle TaxID=49168 RepID=A0ACC0P4Z4_RHOML|nr:hypothetical protein RHMOL_Rhmol04G0268300 [Rhododendron molle]
MKLIILSQMSGHIALVHEENVQFKSQMAHMQTTINELKKTKFRILQQLKDTGQKLFSISDYDFRNELLELGEAVGTQSRGLSQDLISMLPVKKFKCGFFSRRNQEMRGITKEGLHCSVQFWNYETKWK